MLAILILGILLITVPILGFMIAGCVMLYNCLMEDAPAGLFGGLLSSVGIGFVLLLIYFGLLYAGK